MDETVSEQGRNATTERERNHASMAEELKTNMAGMASTIPAFFHKPLGETLNE